jgi:hypothetical protein
MGRSFVRILALIPMALAIGATSASASPIMVTFDDDPVGWIEGNYFNSEDSTLIHFIDTDFQPPKPGETDQGDMAIGNAAFTNSSNALAVFYNDDIGYSDNSALRIVLDVPATSIGMDLLFETAGDGDTAMLMAFSGPEHEVVGQTSAELMEGYISFDCLLSNCSTFDRVEIQFVRSTSDHMVEIVDNVNVTLIPEPHAAVVFGAGALLVGAACARRGRT